MEKILQYLEGRRLKRHKSIIAINYCVEGHSWKSHRFSIFRKVVSLPRVYTEFAKFARLYS